MSDGDRERTMVLFIFIEVIFVAIVTDWIHGAFRRIWWPFNALLADLEYLEVAIHFCSSVLLKMWLLI